MRGARTRAGLSQAALAERLGTPRSQIARWEADEVDPGFATVRRLLQACGFDLSMALIAYAPDEARDESLRALQRLTPQERLERMLRQLEEQW
jgi:transcriptional regulator with XRE-family HTH domain